MEPESRIATASALPWGEVDARSAAGEGVRSHDKFYALTPTLSPRERESCHASIDTGIPIQTDQFPEVDRPLSGKEFFA